MSEGPKSAASSGSGTIPKRYRKYLDKIDAIQVLNLLDRADAEEVLARSKLYDLPADATIVEQGDRGDALIILLAGNAAAHYTDKYGNKRYLSKFKAGDFFGERGFFRDGIRNASIYTATSSTLMEVSSDVLKELINRYPKVYDLIYNKLEEREKNFRLKVVSYLKLVKDREKRDRVEGEAKFHLAGIDVKDAESHFGFVKDFSPSGCLVEIDGNQFMKYQSNIVGKLIPLAVKLDGVSGVVSAVGRVCWYEQASGIDVMGYRVCFGVQFIKLFGDSEKLIAGLNLRTKAFSRKE
jgi:hypothetical protein